MLTNVFDYTPPFKIEDFFQPGSAIDRKVSFVIALIQMVKTKDAQLSKRQAGKNKTKSVTFRQEDSVAFPKSTSKKAAEAPSQLSTQQSSDPKKVIGAESSDDGQHYQHSQRKPYLMQVQDTHSLGNTMGPANTKMPHGILTNAHQPGFTMEQKRQSVPNTGIEL